MSTISLSTINTFIHEQRQKLNFPGDTYLWYLYLPVLWVFIKPSAALNESLFAIATTSEIVDPSAHVPTFYAPDTASGNTDTLIGFVLPVVAMLFGALHCIGWNFSFPTDVEQLLWRIGSFAITAIPSMLFVFGLLKKYGGGFIIQSDMLVVMVLTVGGFLVGAGLIGYMLARLLLLTQAIVLLRDQPESAFYAINWAYFLPHI